MKRGAIALSANMLVIIIISLVVLGLGMTFLFNLMGGADDVKDKLDAKTEQQLENLLIDKGKQVALPLNQVDLQRGESHVFGLGILNIGDEKEFITEVTFSRAADVSGKEIVFTDEQKSALVNEGVLFHPDPVTLADNEHYKLGIMITLPKNVPLGTYIFNVKVFANNEQYDNTQKIYITAK